MFYKVTDLFHCWGEKKPERKQNIEFGMNQAWKVTSLQIPNVQRDSGNYKATRGPVEKQLGGKLVSGRHENTAPNLERAKFEAPMESIAPSGE